MSLRGDDRLRELATRAGLGELSTTALRAIAVAACVLVLLACWRFWPRAPEPDLRFDEVSATAPAASASLEATPAESPVQTVVHVAGAVMRPGVYQLPPGARVDDAIEAAGGVLAVAATGAINLARLVTDGEQVYVPTADEVAAGAVTGPASASGLGAPGGGAGGGLVDVNRAGQAELETLPGVGPATARKIMDDREKNGPFATPEDLMRVPGIGPKKFESLKDLVTCG